MLLVGVLSERAAAYDPGQKFRFYSQQPSRREYALVSQRRRVLQVFYRKGPDALWQMQWYAEASVRLQSLDVTLPLADLYRRTENL